jgi:hypothetical protein
MKASPNTGRSAADKQSDTKSGYRRLKMPVGPNEKDAWLGRILATPGLSNATLRMAIYVAIRVNRKTGCFFASRETIAEAIGGLCGRSITRSIAELKANDLLGVEGGGGRLMVKGELVGRANEYFPLLLDAEQPGHFEAQPGHADARQPGHFEAQPGHADARQPGHFETQPGHMMSTLPKDSLPIDSPLRGESADAPASMDGIPFMITQAMKAKLRDRGYSDDQISNLTPEQAHAILGTPPPIAGIEKGRRPTRQRLTEPVHVTGKLNGQAPELDLGHTAKPTRTPKLARPARARTEWPADFVFEQHLAEMARENAGWDRARGEHEFRRFRAHHESKGTQFKNWRKAWESWCLKGKTIDAEKAQNGFNGNRSYQPKPTVLDDVREAHRLTFPEKYQ